MQAFTFLAKAILRAGARTLPPGAKQALLEGILASGGPYEQFQQMARALGVESMSVRGETESSGVQSLTGGCLEPMPFAAAGRRISSGSSKIASEAVEPTSTLAPTLV